MDNTKLSTMFNGREITYSPLKPTQITMLPILRFSKDEARAAHLLFRVIEGAVGPEEWARIEDAMFLGEVDFEQFIELLTAMASGTAEHMQKVDEVKAEEPVVDVAEEIRKAEEFLAKHRTSEA